MTQIYRPGRSIGIVARDTDRAGQSTRERGYVFIADAQGQEIFAHRSAWGDLWHDQDRRPRIGTPVTFKVTVTTKGSRAWEIALADEREAATIAALEEDRGNR